MFQFTYTNKQTKKWLYKSPPQKHTLFILGVNFQSVPNIDIMLVFGAFRFARLHLGTCDSALENLKKISV